MIRFFRVLGRVLGWLLRTRVLRPVFVLAICVWLLDGIVGTVTDAAWFASVGMGELWREQFAWSAGVGIAFFVLAVGASVPVMRAVARPVAKSVEEPPLPRALARWQVLRTRATRLGWLYIAGVAILLGHGLSSRWSEFALASSASPLQSNALADFWMLRAPALQSSLAAAWVFVLALGLVALVAGALRALPFLAARPSVVPVRWLRGLWCVGATLCLLRALGFVAEALRHAQVANDSLAGRSGFVAFNVLGIVGCILVAFLLRRPRPTLALVVLAVLVVPEVGADLWAPFVGRSSLVPALPAPFEFSRAKPDDWPLWDEATLLRSFPRPSRDSQRRLITWQRAGISGRSDGSGSRVDIVGSPILTDEWARHGLTDRDGYLDWQSIDLPEQRVAREGEPTGPLFYGLNGRPLINVDSREVGVPFQGWLWKFTWAWRLRDPLLLVEGARAQHLLVVRGAREMGQKLAPFWTWDDVVPRRDAQTGDAYFECVAYSSSAYFPRRAAFGSGVFAGQNWVAPVAVLRVDARSGAVRLAPFASSGSGPLVTRWKAIQPSLFGSNELKMAPTPALEATLASGTSLVWIRTSMGWQKKAVPLDLREALSKKMDDFAGVARSHSDIHLEGATPMVWRQNGELFLAQAFFDMGHFALTPSASDTSVLPSPKGVAVGRLNAHDTQWSATFAGARAALLAPNRIPGSSEETGLPGAGTARPARDIAQEALRAERAADEALKAGRYVEAQKQRARAHALLEQLAQ